MSISYARCMAGLLFDFIIILLYQSSWPPIVIIVLKRKVTIMNVVQVFCSRLDESGLNLVASSQSLQAVQIAIYVLLKGV